LVGEKGILPYKAVFCLMVVVGAIWKLEPVLNFSDSALALMIVPNLLTLLILAPTVKRATKEYFGKMKG
jgi:AGCS family alanine or glycine:cation symporter